MTKLASGTMDSPAVLAKSYIAELRNADKQQSRWRRVYYQWRGFVIVASAAITAFTAVSLHGEAAFAIRVLTLVLSALVTVVTGLLELLQVNNRWHLYRQLRGRLESLGWGLAVKEATAAAAVANLGNGLVSAMQDFEKHYMSQVAGTDQTDGTNAGTKNASAGSKAKPGGPEPKPPPGR